MWVEIERYTERQQNKGLRTEDLEPAQPTQEQFQITDESEQSNLKSAPEFPELLRDHDPAFGAPAQQAMDMLQRAAGGQPFKLVDHTSELRSAQKSWRLGGHANSRSGTWGTTDRQSDSRSKNENYTTTHKGRQLR